MCVGICLRRKKKEDTKEATEETLYPSKSPQNQETPNSNAANPENDNENDENETIFLINIFLVITLLSILTSLNFTFTHADQECSDFDADLSLALVDKVALQEFTSGNHFFTAALYKKIVENGAENFLVSPFAVQLLLILAQCGGQDETSQEIRTALHLPNNPKELRSTIKTLITTLKDNQSLLLAGNKMYVQKHFSIKKEFQKVADQVYETSIENVDFSNKSDAANIVNEWAKKQTNNKIQNLIDSSNLGSGTSMILLNVSYFKGTWLKSFNKEATSLKAFYKTTKNKIQVDTMEKTASYNYYDSAELKAEFLEIPFRSEDLCMVIVLPKERDGLAALETQAEKVFTEHKFMKHRVNLSLPKFTIESRIRFKKFLQNLGVKKAFMNDADFSGIVVEKGLSISDVVQKSLLDVCEEGVETVASTTGLLTLASFGKGSSTNTTSFIADHPFIFYVKVQDVIILGGRIIAPSY